MYRYLALSGKLIARIFLQPRRATIYLEAFVWVFIAFVLRSCIPFNSAVRVLGLRRLEDDQLAKLPENKDALMASAQWREIGSVFDRVSALFSPQRPCLLSAYAARIYLGIRKKPFVLCMGVIPGSNQTMTAHAWVIVEDTIFTGYKGWSDAFVRVAGFSSKAEIRAATPGRGRNTSY